MGPENFPPLLSIVKGVFEGLVEMMLDGTGKANEFTYPSHERLLFHSPSRS